MRENQVKDSTALNVDLNNLIFFTLDHAVNCVKATRPLVPFVIIETKGERRLTRFAESDRLESNLQQARRFVCELTRDEPQRYALAYEGLVKLQGREYDAVIVESGERGKGMSIAIAQRYRVRNVLGEFETVGNPINFGSAVNPISDQHGN